MTEDLNADFWSIVGKPLDFAQLRVGEVFLLEMGAIRQWSKLVRRNADGSLTCCRADEDEIPAEPYKVVVLKR